VVVSASATDRRRDVQDDFPGSYTPKEASGYLWVTMPPELRRQRPPTVGRIRRWIEHGVLAPERHGVMGRGAWIDFEDLVSARAVTLLREAHFSLKRIAEAERTFVEVYDIRKPFAHKDFWFGHPRIFGRLREGVLVSDQGQLAWDLVTQWLTPLRSGIDFSDTGRANYWEPTGWEGISLRPTVQFGQSCLKGTRIPTRALWSYHEGGDSASAIAEAYGIEVAEVERAVTWERAVRSAVDHPAPLPH